MRTGKRGEGATGARESEVVFGTGEGHVEEIEAVIDGLGSGG